MIKTTSFFVITLFLVITAVCFLPKCFGASLLTNQADMPNYKWTSAYSQQDENPAETAPLPKGRSDASVVLVNTTFLVLGGCSGENNEDCLEGEHLATEIDGFDAVTGERVDVVATLGFESNLLPSYPRGWAGRHAVVTINQQIYIMHMCSIFRSSNISSNLSAADREFYTQTDTIATSFSMPAQTASNVSAFPFPLANASCTINQFALVVIGGVNLDTKEINPYLYVYDVTDQTGWQQVTDSNAIPFEVPAQQVAVTADSGSIYVVGGIGADGKVVRHAIRFVLWTNLPSLMCNMSLPPVPTRFLPELPHENPASIARLGLDHTLHVFGGNLLYFYKGSSEMARLNNSMQHSSGTWDVESIPLTPPGAFEANVSGYLNCSSQDVDQIGGTLFAATVMSNVSGSVLYVFRIGGSETVTCWEYYTTTTTTTTTITTTTSTTSETPTNTTTETTLSSTTTGTTTATTTSLDSTTTTTSDTPTPPPAPTTVQTTSTTSTSTSSASLQLEQLQHASENNNNINGNLEFIRILVNKSTSRRIFIAKTEFFRPPVLVADDGHINTLFHVAVNTSIDPDLVKSCNRTAQPCTWRIANSFACIADDGASNRWNLARGAVTNLRLGENQYPLYICFQDAKYPPPDAACSAVAGATKTSFDVLNRIGPILSTMGDNPAPKTTMSPNATTASPGGNNNNNSPEPPLLSEGAIIGIVIAACCFLLVVLLAWSKRLRSEDLSSAAAIVRDARYEYLETLGEGAFGQVVRVRRRADDEIFALKYIEIPTSREMHEALHEFEITRQLQNFPNIITIHDLFLNFELDSNYRKSTRRSGSNMMMAKSNSRSSNDPDSNAPLLGNNNNNNTLPDARRRSSNLEAPNSSNERSSELQRPKRVLCLVMDYHPDGDLRRMIFEKFNEETEDKIPEPLLSHITLQLLRTLDHIHGKGIVHRDIKPENILMARSTTKYGQGAPPEMFQKIVVTDFGLAKIMEMNSDGLLFAGSMAYAAPEQLRYLQYFFNPPAVEEGPKFMLGSGGGNNNNNNKKKKSNLKSPVAGAVETKKDNELAISNNNNNSSSNNKNQNNNNNAAAAERLPLQSSGGASDQSLSTRNFTPREKEETAHSARTPSIGAATASPNNDETTEKKKNDQSSSSASEKPSSPVAETNDTDDDGEAQAIRTRSNVNSSTNLAASPLNANSDNDHAALSMNYGSTDTTTKNTATAAVTAAPPPSRMPAATNAKPPVPSCPADVFSLGCVIYACMTKKLTPETGVRQLAKELLEKFGGNDDDFDRQITRELVGLNYSVALVSLVVAMLKANPEERIVPSAALQYFRRSVKDHTYYVSSKAVQQEKK